MEEQTKALLGLSVILGLALAYSIYRAKKEAVVVTAPLDPTLKSTIETVASEITKAK
jgi:hypothetical protein